MGSERMPRPREVGPGEIVSTKLSLRDAQLLRELAKREGLSVSHLLRKIVLEYLQRMGVAQEASAAGADPQQPDPLTLLEVEDLRSAVSRLEKQVERLEAMAKPLLVGRSGPRVLRGSDLELMDRVQRGVFRLRREWYELKRWWARLNRESQLPLDDVKGRLIDLHGRIRSVERAL
ncbi:MAG: hypothetical protein QXU69_08475 [Thermofilaceae archaeon]